MTAYTERLVLDRPDASVLLLESNTGPGYSVGGKLVLAPSAPMLWFVFPGSWSSVARFHLADGTFTGWYTNLCTPVKKNGSTWSSTDLFLDLWIPASGAYEWLDEDELADAVESGLLGREQLDLVNQERSRIEAALKTGNWPPPVCLEIDLAGLGTP